MPYPMNKIGKTFQKLTKINLLKMGFFFFFLNEEKARKVIDILWMIFFSSKKMIF